MIVTPVPASADESIAAVLLPLNISWAFEDEDEKTQQSKKATKALFVRFIPGEVKKRFMDYII